MQILPSAAWLGDNYLRANFALATGPAKEIIQIRRNSMLKIINKFPPMLPHFEICQTHGFIERTLTSGIVSIMCPRTNRRRFTIHSSVLRIGATHYVVYHFIDGPRLDLVMGYIYNFPVFLFFHDSQSILLVGTSTINDEIDHIGLARTCMDLEIKPPGAKAIVWVLADQNSLGHSYWQNGTGYDFLKTSGLIRHVDAYTEIQYDFFSIGQHLKKVEGICEHTGGDALFFCFSDFVMLKSAREELLRSVSHDVWMRHQPKAGACSVLLQLRSGFRRWESQIAGIVCIVNALVEQYPHIEIIIDGRSDWQNNSASEDGYQTAEREMYDEIIGKVHYPQNVTCTVGWKILEKISKFSHLHAFSAPIGSGTTIPYWLLNKRGVVYGPPAMYGWSQDQAEHLIDDIRRLSWFPVDRVRITAAAEEPRNSDYDFDWQILLDLLIVQIEGAEADKKCYWCASFQTSALPG